MIQVKEAKNHYINATALSFGENDLGSPNRVAVSLVGGAAILVHVKGTIDYAADGNFQRWTLKGYSTKLAANTPYYIYARLDRSAPEALITFSANRYALDGSIEGDSSTAPSTRYWYVRIGQLSETDGVTNRELTYDSGALGTDMEINKGNDLIEEAFIFHYDDTNDPKKLTAIQAKAGLWTDYFLSAKGNNNIGTSGTGGASKLGELINVSSDADIVHATDKILTLSAGDNLWKLSDLSDMVGLDENALFDYLTRNSYAKKSDIPSLSGYATESWVKQQGYLTQHQDLSDYAKKDDIPTNVSAFNNDANYATVSDLDNRIDALVNGAPAAYDTLKEIADVLSKNVDSIDDIITALGNKVNQSDFDDTITDINTSIDNLSKELGLKLDASIFNDLFEKVEISKGVWAIKAKLGLFSDSFISAKGSNNSGTGSTGGAVALYKLNDVKEGDNAVYGATDGAVLVYDGSTGKWQGVEQSKIVPNLSGYATEQWVKQQGYLTQHQDLSGYAKLTDIPVIPTADIEKGVTAYGWGDHSKVGYLTSHQSLDGYVNEIATSGSGNAITSVSKSGKKLTFTKGATYLTSITSKLVTDALGYTPFDSNSFTKSNIKSTLGISDWALEASKPGYAFSDLTSHPTTINGYGITDSYTSTEVNDLLKSYVDLDTAQTITNAKTFGRNIAFKNVAYTSDAEFNIFQATNGVSVISHTKDSFGSRIYTSEDGRLLVLEMLNPTTDHSYLNVGLHMRNEDISGWPAFYFGCQPRNSRCLTGSGDLFSYAEFSGLNLAITDQQTSVNNMTGVTLEYVKSDSALRIRRLIIPTPGGHTEPTDDANLIVSKVSTNKIQIGDGFIEWDATNNGFKVTGGLYTEGYLSAKGANSNGGSSSGGGLIESVYQIDKFGQTFDQYENDTFNAFAINSLHERLSDLENKATSVSYTAMQTSGTKIGTITIDGSSKVIYAPAIPTKVSSFTNDANYATISDLDSRINALINGAPAAYDTLKEIADVLSGNVNSIDDIITTLGTKANKDYVDNTLKGYQPLITSSNKLAYSLISGTPTLATVATSGKYSDLSGLPTIPTVPTSLKNPYSLKFGTKTYDGSTEKTITAADLGALTAHQDLSGYQTKITSTNKLSASLVSGLATVATSGKYSDLSELPTIPTSLKSPYSLTFGSKTYDGSAAKEIVASDLGALTSHQTIYALTIKNSGGTTQLTYTPNSAAGSLTLTKAMVGLGNVENTKLSTWAGTENITTLGTITTGTWNGSKIGNSYLSNSSISIAGTSVSLGSSITADTLKNNLGLGSFAYKSSLAFSDLTGKPTTISGYGITDAKIANGVITLGTNTITPLTSHQTIYNLTLQAGTFTAVTFDPNGAAKTVNIPTTTSHISEGSNLYFTNARAVSALSSTVTGINNSITTLNGYFSNGVANSAAKLTTISKTAWGQTYWTSGGVPTSISGNMTGVGSITMTGAISGVTSITASGAISTSSTISATAGIWSDGYVSAKGQNTSSDIRLKEFIKDVYLSVSDISHAPSMLFKWKSGGGFDIGSSAQYWQRLLPNAVKERNGFLEMQYANIALISAISLAKNLESHEERISRLEREIIDLRIENEKLKINNTRI